MSVTLYFGRGAIAGACFSFGSLAWGADSVTVHFTSPFSGDLGKFTMIDAGAGVVAQFTPSNDRTLAQFERDLHQDHLNFFQKVTEDTSPEGPGKPKIPFIDPPKGGLTELADSRPWYWNEEAGMDHQLSDNIINDGKTLRFEDAPGGFLRPNSQITYETFLVSDYGDKTYAVFQPGFKWTIKFDAQGNPSIASIAEVDAFNSEFVGEISEEFGWTRVGTLPIPPELASVPESGAFGVFAAGAMSLVALRRPRRRVVRKPLGRPA